MLLPGVYSVMVPLPSVVVVVVVVCDTCAHANGAANPSAMHRIILFIFPFFYCRYCNLSSLSCRGLFVVIRGVSNWGLWIRLPVARHPGHSSHHPIDPVFARSLVERL